MSMMQIKMGVNALLEKGSWSAEQRQAAAMFVGFIQRLVRVQMDVKHEQHSAACLYNLKKAVHDLLPQLRRKWQSCSAAGSNDGGQPASSVRTRAQSTAGTGRHGSVCWARDVCVLCPDASAM